jgi:hypothetical protein
LEIIFPFRASRISASGANMCHIEVILFAFMAQDIGEKEGEYMRSKIKYTEEPMGKLRVIKDFLPPPEKLVLKEENIKVTIALKKTSI